MDQGKATGSPSTEKVTPSPHTPLPWRAEPGGWTPWDGAIGILPANQDEEHSIAWTTSGDNEVANAAFIVRAVNNHYALVDALETSRRQIVTLGGDIQQNYGDEIQAAILRQIDAALSAAKGEP